MFNVDDDSRLATQPGFLLVFFFNEVCKNIEGLETFPCLGSPVTTWSVALSDL